MKTLLFCTAWAGSTEAWNYRYGRWLDAARRLRISIDQILLVDDGSPVPPSLDRVAVYRELPRQQPESREILFRFRDNLGRKATCDYPGWWRSFNFAIRYGRRFGFERIVHLESDAYLLSDAIAGYVDGLHSGWTTFWCPRWQIPDSCIQVICSDQLDWFDSIGRNSYDRYRGIPIETIFPFTHVEAGFKGDRYGEYRTELPLDADYASQVPLSSQIWTGTPPPPRRLLAITSKSRSTKMLPLLYPTDAWDWNVRSLASLDGAESYGLDESLDALFVDAIDLSSFPVELAIRSVADIKGDAELALRFSAPGLTRDALYQYLVALSKSDVSAIGAEFAPSEGWWILLQRRGEMPTAIARERSIIRLRLVAQKIPSSLC
jgi:hypothetical protein